MCWLPEFRLSLEENSRILQCCSCAEFLSSAVSFSSSFRRPLGKATGSLATGLYLSEEVYEQLIAGKCDKWYHQKKALIKHLSSKMHINAADYMKSVKEGRMIQGRIVLLGDGKTRNGWWTEQQRPDESCGD